MIIVIHDTLVANPVDMSRPAKQDNKESFSFYMDDWLTMSLPYIAVE